MRNKTRCPAWRRQLASRRAFPAHPPPSTGPAHCGCRLGTKPVQIHGASPTNFGAVDGGSQSPRIGTLLRPIPARLEMPDPERERPFSIPLVLSYPPPPARQAPNANKRAGAATPHARPRDLASIPPPFPHTPHRTTSASAPTSHHHAPAPKNPTPGKP